MVDMFMDEYDEERIGALFREDGRREGLEEGRKEGLKEGRGLAFAELVRDGILSAKDAAARAGVSEDEISKMAADIG